LCAAVLFLLQEAPVPQPWDGFAPGSWVVTVQTHERGKQFIQKQLLNKDRSVSVTDAASGKEDGAALPPGKPLTDGLQKTAERSETLVVRGTKLECTVVVYANENGKKKLTVWHAKGVSIPNRIAAFGVWVSVPADVVRAERVEPSGAWTVTTTLEVIDLDAKLEIHGRTFRCVVQDTRCNSEVAGQLPVVRNRRHWICDEIPGRIARREEECRQGNGGGGWVVDVTDFHALR
jgi:hypothetical protein